MSRLSRDKKREQQGAADPAAGEAAPIDVRVTGTGPGAGGASVGGVPVVAAPGEELQHAVLAQLHRIAFAAGHPVLATIHDERIGYVVPLRVDPDGSSQFTAEPVLLAAPAEPANASARAPHDPPAPAPAPAVPQTSTPQTSMPEPTRTAPGTVAAPTGQFGPPPVMDAQPAARTDHWPVPPTTPEPALYPESNSGPERALYPESGSTPEPVAYPQPAPASATHQEWPPAPQPIPHPDPYRANDATPTGHPAPTSHPTPANRPNPSPTATAARPFIPDPASVREPDPKPTPARGFDAVAEAVLGDEPLLAGDAAGPPLLAEPVARINEAVRSGRIETAAALAEQTVAEASGTLGPEHPEVLRLRELTAYILYLADDPVRSLHLSLDLAGLRRGAGDAEAAYGNVQSAATAWRAVRDPVQGLNLGVDLIALWSELAAQGGPAADDIEQLESARTRMTRLADRARRAADALGG
ncbi:tetratricopeptide repeat protein [Streptomyces sp. NPDC087903]|uniref:tetratricopeptide repeat protein n=1 Tax=Streptomyces sp. NPDC087903 TaxID=3365819 RepID=UPI003825FB94